MKTYIEKYTKGFTVENLEKAAEMIFELESTLEEKIKAGNYNAEDITKYAELMIETLILPKRIGDIYQNVIQLYATGSPDNTIGIGCNLQIEVPAGYFKCIKTKVTCSYYTFWDENGFQWLEVGTMCLGNWTKSQLEQMSEKQFRKISSKLSPVASKSCA